MPLLNYTTKVPVETTIADISKILTKAKASAVLTEFGENGLPWAMTFRVSINGTDVHFRMPVDIAGVTAALKRDRTYRDEAHARRVAWRIVKDWCEAQMAMITAGQAEIAQVFLPYAVMGSGETLFHKMKSTGFLQIAHQGAV